MNSNIRGNSPFVNSSSSSESSEFDEWLEDEIEAMDIEEQIIINMIARNNYVIHHLLTQQSDQVSRSIIYSWSYIKKMLIVIRVITIFFHF